MPSPAPLTSSRLLARNTVWNLLGLGTPMLLAIVTIPILVRGMGVERFGVLTLAWMVVGYFSLFDLGLGRALTKYVAEKIGRDEVTEVAAIVWTTLGVMLVLGLLGTALAAALTPWMVKSVLKIPVGLQMESLRSFYLLALSIPVVIATTALRGVLEAAQRFGLVNALRVPMGVFTFAGPVAALAFSPDLDVSIAVLVCGRWVAGLVHFWICWRTLPALMRPPQFRRALIRPLLGFGGWMTVSNLISPLMVYIDRFVIGMLLSVGAVAFYVTPYELMTKMLIIPGAVVAVLFPAFSTSLANDPARAAALLDRGLRYVFIVTFPLTMVAVTLAHAGLGLWLGDAFALNSTRVLQWLAAGVFVNGLAVLPFTFLHGAGRPDLTAKLHVIELPIYLATLWWAVGSFGIEGAAAAWFARVTLDALAILFVTNKTMRSGGVQLRTASAIGVAAFIVLLAGILNGGPLGLAFLALILILFPLVAWKAILGPEERSVLLAQFKSLPEFRS